MTRYIKLLAQTVLLWGIYYLSNLLAQYSGLPIPGNVVGVVLLFVLLCLGVVKLSYIQDAADFLLKHLIFFFVPMVVGLMNYGRVFYDYGLVLALAVVASAILPFWTVGHLSQWLYKDDNK